MTENRDFKNKVKNFADVNDLSYTDAKKITVKTYERFTPEFLKYIQKIGSERMLSSKEVKDPLFIETPDSERSVELKNGKFIQFGTENKKFVSLSELGIDIYPINFLPFSNISQGTVFISDENSVRIAFSHFVENYFGTENSFFIEEVNYFSQMFKVIKHIEKMDNNTPVLIGFLPPDWDGSPSKRDVFDRLNKQINDLTKENKNICFITNKSIFIEEKESEIDLFINKMRKYGASAAVYKSEMIDFIKNFFNLLKYIDKKKVTTVDWNSSKVSQIISIVMNEEKLDEIINTYNESKTSKSVHNKLSELQKDTDLIKMRKELKTQLEEVEFSLNNITIIEYMEQLIKENDKKPTPIRFLPPASTSIKYYPYDRIHGGSYYKTTNKKVIGHSEGIPKFFNNNIVFIENDGDYSAIEKIAKLNNSEVLNIQNSEELLNTLFFNRSKTIFSKIDFTIDEKELSLLIRKLSSIARDLDPITNEDEKTLLSDLKIVIESEQAEEIYSLLAEENPELENRFKMISKIYGSLFVEELGEIELYNVD